MKNYFSKIFLSICLFYVTNLSSQNYADSVSLFLSEHPQLDSAQFFKAMSLNMNLIYDAPKVAIANYEILKAIATKQNYKDGIIWILKDSSIPLQNTGNINASLESLFKALTLCDTSKSNIKSKAAILNNIGNIYIETEEYSKAITYLNEAAFINKQKNYLNYLSINYNNLGLCYKGLNQNERALYYHKKAMEIRLKKGKNENLAQSYLNISELYLGNGYNDSALYYGHLAEQICDSVKSDFGLSFVYTSLGSIYEKQNKLNIALDYYQKSFNLSKKINHAETLINSSLCLYNINKKLLNYKDAMFFQEVYYKTKDSIFNLETTKKTLSLEYQNELNNRKIEQEKKDLVSKRDKEQQKSIKNIFISGFGIMLLLSLIILNGYRNKKKANKIIAAQKEETEQQKILLEEKQKEIIGSIHYAKRIQQSLLPTEKYIDKSITRLTKK